MLVVETIGRIRREHSIKGKSIKEISRDLRISRNTVRKVLRSGKTAFDYQREVQPRPKLAAHRCFRPARNETGDGRWVGYNLCASAQRSACPWCLQARQLVGPGTLEHPELCGRLATASEHVC